MNERRQQALEDWRLAREECSKVFEEASTGLAFLGELQDESRILRERLEELRQKCSGLALEVCVAQVETQQRQQQLLDRSLIDVPRQRLTRVEKALCQESGSMVQTIEQARRRVRAQRFHFALTAFKMRRLDVEVNNDDRTKVQSGRIKHARGIGKIGGLPLPHAGPELFGVLPQDELQSALRLVASLTSLVSRCLGIILPHPILLKPDSPVEEDISDFAEWKTSPASFGDGNSTDPTSSMASLASFAERATRNVFASAIGSQHRNLQVTKLTVPPSLDPDKVRQRLNHSRAAILAESKGSSSLYSLAANVMHEDEFAVALSLLQNDVIALCIRAAVPVAQLWPAEAVLLK